ncbi:vacuolar iron transporter homolog 3-like [Nymphaea colorata]|uniref:vacuolar iron transporter homolog 3-like n=1 Tax=Nymphaea colorata TaxID=210225 RepID=UPI00129DF65A|nr:vacuolar iron transporter homolog 3-like [Nymphaea colorata]
MRTGEVERLNNQSVKAMVVSALAGLIAGAFTVAISEYAAASSQVDIQFAQMETARRYADAEMLTVKEKHKLLSPLQAAGVRHQCSSSAFIKQRWTRVGVLSGASTCGFAFFG